MQFQYPALVKPLIAITDYNNPEVFYPDLLDVRSVPVDSYFVEPILPIIPLFFADYTEDFYLSKKEEVLGYYVEPLVPLAPIVFDPALFPRVGYPDFLDVRSINIEGENYREVSNFNIFLGVIPPEFVDSIDRRSDIDLSNVVLPFQITPALTFKNWDVEYPDVLLRSRDDSYFPDLFHTKAPVIPPGVANKLSLIEFYNLRVRLDVKKAVDSGVVSALSTDVSGTTVTFNKAFKDVDSIVGTVQETNNFVVVIDFVDIPNPTTFKVYVFDVTGARATKTVYWVARGII